MQAQKVLVSEMAADLEAAQTARRDLQRQVASSSSAGPALHEAQAAADILRQQLEEAMRKYSTVKQARERAMSEVSFCLALCESKVGKDGEREARSQNCDLPAFLSAASAQTITMLVKLVHYRSKLLLACATELNNCRP